MSNMNSNISKKAMGPRSVYTPEEQRKGLYPLVGSPSKIKEAPISGYVMAVHPIADILKTTGKSDAIKALISDFNTRTGMSINIEELPLFQIINPNNVYVVDGRPVVYLDYESKVKQQKGVKSTVPVSSKYVDLTTFEIIDASDVDPATLQHDIIVGNMQREAAVLINQVLVNTHNKMVDYICSNGMPPLQNIAAMLNKSKRLMNQRIAGLKTQVERLSAPREIPAGAQALNEKVKKELGIEHDEAGEIQVSPSQSSDGLINNIQDVFYAFVAQYWDSPEKLINAYESGVVKRVFMQKVPTLNEQEADEVSKSLVDVMKIVKSDWDEARAKSKAYIDKRKEEKPKEEQPKPTPDWVVRKIKPIAEEDAAKLIRRRSLYPDKYRGFRSFKGQAGEAISSIEQTEIETMERSLNAVTKIISWLQKKYMELKKNNMTLSVKNFSPSDKGVLCTMAQDLQKFTEGYAEPLLNEQGKIDKRKMGYSKDPIANMLVSSYLGLCQSALVKIACEGAPEDISLLCGSGAAEAEIG